MSKRSFYLILHNVRSAYNVGAIFRTADGAGVDHIYLTGYTPCPPDGSRPYTTKPERMIIKTALGAHTHVSWSHSDDVATVVHQLKNDDTAIVALEQGDRSVDYRSYVVKGNIAVIVGNEPVGIDSQTLALCDTMIDIPMRGQKKSLNVAVATGIAIYALTE